MNMLIISKTLILALIAPDTNRRHNKWRDRLIRPLGNCASYAGVLAIQRMCVLGLLRKSSYTIRREDGEEDAGNRSLN